MLAMRNLFGTVARQQVPALLRQRETNRRFGRSQGIGGETMLKVLGGTVGVIFLIGLLVVIGLLMLIF